MNWNGIEKPDVLMQKSDVDRTGCGLQDRPKKLSMCQHFLSKDLKGN
jgi:hypothetical protein